MTASPMTISSSSPATKEPGPSPRLSVKGNANAEALRLTGVNDEGVTSATLGSAAAVATAFNKEFAITAANGEDALLLVNDTNGNSFSAWQWIQARGGETSGSELTLIGTFVSNATVGTASFDFI